MPNKVCEQSLTNYFDRDGFTEDSSSNFGPSIPSHLWGFLKGNPRELKIAFNKQKV